MQKCSATKINLKLNENLCNDDKKNALKKRRTYPTMLRNADV